MDDFECPGAQCFIDGDKLLQTRSRMELADGLGAEELPEELGTPDDGDDEHPARLKGADVELSEDEADEALQSVFRLYDKDHSGALDEDELHHGLFDGDKVMHGENISVREAALDIRRSRHLVELYDADDSGSLNWSEFGRAMAAKHNRTRPAGELLLQDEDGRVVLQRRTGTPIKCVSNIIEEVWDDAGCLVNSKHQECGTWRIVSCAWKVITHTVGCIVKVVKKAVASFEQCLPQIIEYVKEKAIGESAAFMDYLPSFAECGDPMNCFQKFISKAGKLVGLIGNEVKKYAGSLLGNFKSGFGSILNLQKIAAATSPDEPANANAALISMSITPEAIVDMVKATNWSFVENFDTCTPEGYGLWNISLSDCGAFEALQKTMTEGVTKIQENFMSTAGKFAECISKKNLFSLPTPFMDIGLQRCCLPEPMAVTLKTFIGAIKHFMATVQGTGKTCEAVAAGEKAMCELVDDIVGIGKRLRNLFRGKTALLLQESASKANALLRSRSNSSSNLTNGGGDYKVVFKFGMGMSIPIPGLEGCWSGKTFVSFGGVAGKRNGKRFFDLIMDLESEQPMIPGMGAGVAMDPQFSLAFDIGTPQSNLVGGSSGVRIAGPLPLALVGLPLKATGKLGFIVTNDSSFPRGFMFSVSMPVPGASIHAAAVRSISKFAAERAAMVKNVQNTIANVAGPLKFQGGLVAFAKTLAQMDIVGQIREAIPAPETLLVEGAASAHEETISNPLKSTTDLTLCITCLIRDGVKIVGLEQEVEEDEADLVAEDVPASQKRCEDWCKRHSDRWTAKCSWNECASCNECFPEARELFVLKHHGGKCIHPDGGSDKPGNGVKLQLHDGCKLTRPALQFRKLQAEGDKFLLQHESGRCVHPEGGSDTPENGVKLHYWEGCDRNNRALIFEEQKGRDGFFVFAHAGEKCVHPDSGGHMPGSGTELVFWDGCNQEPVLQFRKLWLHQFFIIKHSGGRCVHPVSGSENPGNGDKLHFWDGCDRADSKLQFQELPGPDGYFVLQHLSGKCVHPDGGSDTPDNGVKIHFWDGCDTSNNKLLFRKLPVEHGRFVLQHKSGKCIHPDNGADHPGNGVKLHFWDGCQLDRGALQYVVEELY